MWGSGHHVVMLQRNKSIDQVEGVYVLEMIGYAVDGQGTQATPVRIPFLLNPSRVGDFILVVGNFRSGKIGANFERSIRRYGEGLEYFSVNRMGGFFRDAVRSDHSSYWRADMKAIMITDTANFRNPHYHKQTDVVESLNFEFMEKVCQSVVASLLVEAGIVTGRQGQAHAELKQ